jgi:deoxyribodipyrimidine photo-lyase
VANTSSENLAARSGGEKPAGSPALVWFREDLRIGDNPALDAAVKSGRPVVAVYIFDPVSQGVRPIGAAQKWMLHQALTALAGKLEGLGSRLVLRAGPAGDVLPLIAGQTGAAAVYWNRRHVGAEVAIDTALKQQLTAAGIEV